MKRNLWIQRASFTLQNLRWFRSTSHQRIHVFTEFDLAEWYFDQYRGDENNNRKRNSQCNPNRYYCIGIQLKFIGFFLTNKTTDARKPGGNKLNFVIEWNIGRLVLQHGKLACRSISRFTIRKAKTNNGTARPQETPSRRNDKRQTKGIIYDAINDRIIFMVRRRTCSRDKKEPEKTLGCRNWNIKHKL